MQTDLCEQMKTLDEECPLEGPKIITKEVDIPSKVPSVGIVHCYILRAAWLTRCHMKGNYQVTADVKALDESAITCLEAHVHF